MTQAKKKKFTETEVSFQPIKRCYCIIDTTKRVGGGEGGGGGTQKGYNYCFIFPEKLKKKVIILPVLK